MKSIDFIFLTIAKFFKNVFKCFDLNICYNSDKDELSKMQWYFKTTVLDIQTNQLTVCNLVQCNRKDSKYL